jgi:hypothetical protein
VKKIAQKFCQTHFSSFLHCNAVVCDFYCHCNFEFEENVIENVPGVHGRVGV